MGLFTSPGGSTGGPGGSSAGSPHVAPVETTGNDSTGAIGGSPFATAQAAFDAAQAANGPVEIRFGINPAAWGTINAPDGVRDGIVWTGAGPTLSSLAGISVSGPADVHLRSDRSVDLGLLTMTGLAGATAVDDGMGGLSSDSTPGGDCGSLSAAGCHFRLQAGGGSAGTYGPPATNQEAGNTGNITLGDCHLTDVCFVGGPQSSNGNSSGHLGQITLHDCTGAVTSGNLLILDSLYIPESLTVENCQLRGDLLVSVHATDPYTGIGAAVNVLGSRVGAVVSQNLGTGAAAGNVTLTGATVVGDVFCWNLIDTQTIRGGGSSNVVTGSIVELND